MFTNKKYMLCVSPLCKKTKEQKVCYVIYKRRGDAYVFSSTQSRIGGNVIFTLE